MIKNINVLTLGFSCLFFIGCKTTDSLKREQFEDKALRTVEEKAIDKFKNLENLNWQETFYDTGTKDWTENWMLDGLKATITNTSEGMDFFAGPIRQEDASHTVLWTKKIFKGDIRVDYVYTRLDDKKEAVNIIYLLASGSSENGYEKDISKWSDKRKIPKMKLYFNHMNTYHISYAAFGLQNQDSALDYIKLRRYLPNEGKALTGTDFEPLYERTGLFKKGIPHEISIIKKGAQIFMKIKNLEKELLCYWDTSGAPSIEEGRIGLRHMWTRGSRYQDFRVSELIE